MENNELFSEEANKQAFKDCFGERRTLRFNTCVPFSFFGDQELWNKNL